MDRYPVPWKRGNQGQRSCQEQFRPAQQALRRPPVLLGVKQLGGSEPYGRWPASVVENYRHDR